MQGSRFRRGLGVSLSLKQGTRLWNGMGWSPYLLDLLFRILFFSYSFSAFYFIFPNVNCIGRQLLILISWNISFETGTLSSPISLSLSLSLPLHFLFPFTHTHTRTHALSLSLSPTVSLSLSLLSVTHARAHARSLVPFPFLFHTYTHTRTHTHPLSFTLFLFLHLSLFIS